MFKNLLLTFFLFFSSFLTIYPSKKENTNLLDYCYCLEKILSRNSFEKSKNLSNNFKVYLEDISFFGTNKTQGALVNKIIYQYKNSKKFFILNFVPNQIYCLAGYWIEEVSPGIFQSIIYEKSKEKINHYKNIKNEIDEFIKDINFEFNSLKK